MRSRQAVILAVLLGVVVATWFLTRPAGKQARPTFVPPREDNLEQPTEGSSTRAVEEPAQKPEGGTSDSTPNARAAKENVTPLLPAAPMPPAISNQPGPDPGESTTPAAARPQNAVTDRQFNEVLDNVRVMIRDYRAVLGENPVGTNAEIMRAINGDNVKQAKIGPPAGQGLNGNGELVDPWGTPFFFHQISRTEMEIHSAGPDRIMGTADDRQTK
jgi:hypothetical protein